MVVYTPPCDSIPWNSHVHNGPNFSFMELGDTKCVVVHVKCFGLQKAKQGSDKSCIVS